MKAANLSKTGYFWAIDNDVELLEEFDRTNIVNLDIISENFIYELNKCNNTMCMRRLVNFNLSC